LTKLARGSIGGNAHEKAVRHSQNQHPAKAKPDGLTTLLTEVRQLIQSARRSVSTIVDTFQVMTNFEIGRASSSTNRKARSVRPMAQSCSRSCPAS
jgi:hypothetical protein